MFIPITYTQNTTFSYLPKVKSSSYLLYLFLILGVVVTLATLPFIYTDISVRSSGIIRPTSERTEVKPVISGIINKLNYKEGDNIQQGAVILSLKDPNTKSKTLLNTFETTQRLQFIKDLQALSSIDFFKQDIDFQSINSQLSSPLYKEQTNRFLHQKTEQDILLKKAMKELDMNAPLAKEKVISPKEFYDIQIQEQRQQANRKALIQEQLSNWQQDLARYKLELSQYQQQSNQISTDASYYEVKAPTGGVIQGINNRYAGGYLQANDVICNISPSGTLLAECYVAANNVGLLKLHQEARFQIDAFDYNYFGIVTGKVQSIDNDYSVG